MLNKKIIMGLAGVVISTLLLSAYFFTPILFSNLDAVPVQQQDKYSFENPGQLKKPKPQDNKYIGQTVEQLNQAASEIMQQADAIIMQQADAIMLANPVTPEPLTPEQQQLLETKVSQLEEQIKKIEDQLKTE